MGFLSQRAATRARIDIALIGKYSAMRSASQSALSDTSHFFSLAFSSRFPPGNRISLLYGEGTRSPSRGSTRDFRVACNNVAGMHMGEVCGAGIRVVDTRQRRETIEYLPTAAATVCAPWKEKLYGRDVNRRSLVRLRVQCFPLDP